MVTSWKLYDAIRGMASGSDKASTTTAVYVGRDSDGRDIVRLKGSGIATPVNGSMSASAKEGDTLSVDVSNGRLSVVGNLSDPGVGGEYVSEAVGASESAVREDMGQISTVAESAAAIAQEALDVAEATNQYFWQRSDNPDGAGAGAFVTEVPQDEFTDSTSPNFLSGPNALLNSLGLLFRDGMNILMSVLTNGIAIYDGNGNDSTNILAEFTANRIRLGKKPSATEPTYAKVEFFDGDTSLSSSIIPDSEIDGGRRSIFLANNYAVNNLDAYGYLGIAHQIGDDGTNTTENANTTIQAMTGDKQKYAGVSAISISNNGATPSTRVNLHGDYLDLSDGTTHQSFTMANVIEALESGGVGTASTSITLSNLGSGTKTLHLERWGNVVHASMTSTATASTANSAITCGTVPSGYRPTHNEFQGGISVSNNNLSGNYRWRVATTGVITYWCSVTAIRESPMSMTWLTNDSFPS